ncbi:MAG: (2Fe-2S)-binding protein [Rhodobacter sp.]|jgi:carbon-monoxide dehydrogenase small subunit|nr:(2Fe-2S)-binding protein [Rhodobacter sp.]
MSSDKAVTLRINGHDETATVPSHRTLLEALRGLGHVDVKCGCEKGDCGACAVLIDGEAVDSCLTLAHSAAGREITTLQGLGTPENLHPLQLSFSELGAAQCGYCTPGMIIASESLLRKNPSPSEDELRHALSGNLCRCTGYVKIFEAVNAAAEVMRNSGDPK